MIILIFLGIIALIKLVILKTELQHFHSVLSLILIHIVFTVCTTENIVHWQSCQPWCQPTECTQKAWASKSAYYQPSLEHEKMFVIRRDGTFHLEQIGSMTTIIAPCYQVCAIFRQRGSRYAAISAPKLKIYLFWIKFNDKTEWKCCNSVLRMTSFISAIMPRKMRIIICIWRTFS